MKPRYPSQGPTLRPHPVQRMNPQTIPPQGPAPSQSIEEWNQEISRNQQIESDLETLPDKSADALFEWRKATLDREKTEALLYLRFKAESIGEKKTVSDIDAMVDADDGRYLVKLKEASAESEYERIYEKLLAAKKISDIRTAF